MVSLSPSRTPTGVSSALHTEQSVFIRLPKAGTRCPVSNLSRSALEKLTTPSEANAFHPAVRSHLVRTNAEATRGIRLIEYKALIEFIDRQPACARRWTAARPCCPVVANSENEGAYSQSLAPGRISPANTEQSIFVRLPKAGTRCPISSLSRSTIEELTVPTDANGFYPPVASHVLITNPDAMRGIRLINRQSLVDYIKRLREASRGKVVKRIRAGPHPI